MHIMKFLPQAAWSRKIQPYFVSMFHKTFLIGVFIRKCLPSNSIGNKRRISFIYLSVLAELQLINCSHETHYSSANFSITEKKKECHLPPTQILNTIYDGLAVFS